MKSPGTGALGRFTPGTECSRGSLASDIKPEIVAAIPAGIRIVEPEGKVSILKLATLNG
jgi:hypothetical protein